MCNSDIFTSLNVSGPFLNWPQFLAFTRSCGRELHILHTPPLQMGKNKGGLMLAADGMTGSLIQSSFT